MSDMTHTSAEVVPITRLRRDTTTWSYQIPTSFEVHAGQLVLIPFRGRLTPGVVWDVTTASLQARESLVRILSPQPLILTPARQLIEAMSEYGLCSLSTALYVWLPTWLRRWPFSQTTLRELEKLPQSQQAQQAIILPNQRPATEQLLSQYNPVSLFSGETAGETSWWSIQRGTQQLGYGREGALFAPWRNLHQLTIVDPEDIAFYHEQIPYLPLTDLASVLAVSNRMYPKWRSYLPSDAARQLWGKEAQGVDTLPSQLTHVDLSHEPLLNELVCTAISETRNRQQTVLILLNAHDRLVKEPTDARRKLLTGVESIRKQLQERFGTLEGIIIDTRVLFYQQHQNVGLTIALNLDPLLQATLFADQLHGWSDIGHLFYYGGRCIIQSHQPEHPLIQALLQKNWSTYLRTRLTERQTNQLPPFGQQIACSYRGETDQALPIQQKLVALLREPWQISHPFIAPWRQISHTHILLSAPLGERLPTGLRQALVALPRPWKVQRNPWHIL